MFTTVILLRLWGNNYAYPQIVRNSHVVALYPLGEAQNFNATQEPDTYIVGRDCLYLKVEVNLSPITRETHYVYVPSSGGSGAEIPAMKSSSLLLFHTSGLGLAAPTNHNR